MFGSSALMRLERESDARWREEPRDRGRAILPQGPASPDLANLATVRLDARVAGLRESSAIPTTRATRTILFCRPMPPEVFAVGDVRSWPGVYAEEGLQGQPPQDASYGHPTGSFQAGR